jgi:hypothetical protein
MSGVRDLIGDILVDGEDLRIDEADAARIQALLPTDGPIAAEDLEALVELRSRARVVCPAFDRLFFPALKSWLLADGAIDLPEQFQLLRILYGGGGIDEVERGFLKELRRDVKRVTPEFEAICQQALRD